MQNIAEFRIIGRVNKVTEHNKVAKISVANNGVDVALPQLPEQLRLIDRAAAVFQVSQFRPCICYLALWSALLHELVDSACRLRASRRQIIFQFLTNLVEGQAVTLTGRGVARREEGDALRFGGCHYTPATTRDQQAGINAALTRQTERRLGKLGATATDVAVPPALDRGEWTVRSWREGIRLACGMANFLARGLIRGDAG